ncbi:MAG: PD40 domain-containing protein [Bacteroidales bacterium]|nr:PD40 domain-containing protein [Bacteroidales bacterium]
MKNLLLLACLFLFSLIINCQENTPFSKEYFKDNKEGLFEALNNISDGDDYYETGGGGYALALELFLKANEFNPHNAELNYKIGICYLNSIYKTKALDYIQKAQKLDPKVSSDIFYRLGQVYQYNLDFFKAVNFYNLYLDNLEAQEKTSKLEHIEKKIAECRVGMELIKNIVPGIIVNIKALNSPFADFCPVISADESTLIFTSRREKSTGNEKDPNDLQYFEDIYFSKKENNTWSEPENIGEPINTVGHDATVGLSPNGQTLYIYKGDKNGGDIYFCDLVGETWSSPKPLPPTINSPHRETSACLSPDGNTIYFVSDRNKGFGRDIFFSEKNTAEEWTEAKNIGTTINTKFDEEGVFAHPNGKTLYFSSKGHNTMGGYDIFKTLKDENGNWSEPENIGYPINTADDDVFFVVSADGKRGYLSSVRPDGRGEKDIYVFNFSEAQNENFLTLLSGKVTDNETKNPISAEIEITDLSTGEVISVFNNNESSGEYLLTLPSGKNYSITVSAEKYLFYSENFDLPENSKFNEVEINIELNALKENSKIILKNVFFDYARAIIKPESKSELNRLIKILNDNPKIRIEVSGHTDNVSSLETNNRLSNDRAKAVVDYLIENGIDKTRLEYKGYAYFQPVAENDTEENRAKNRRVEFKIIGID